MSKHPTVPFNMKTNPTFDPIGSKATCVNCREMVVVCFNERINRREWRHEVEHDDIVCYPLPPSIAV